MARGRSTRQKKGKQSKSARSESAGKATTAADERDKQALKSLAEKRRLFEPLISQIVAGVLHAHAPPVDGEKPRRDPMWIEVGSGLGQLRKLLPPDVLGLTTHTELSESLTRAFAERHPEARVLAADVAKLPFESATADVVLGLCVFDSLPDPTEATREVRRVLRDGGRFIHFLDAATNIEPILVELVQAELLPLPNFVVDAALLDTDLLEMGALGEFLVPYHDLLTVPQKQFEFVTAMLVQAGHPMAQMLERYAAPFLKRPFDALLAARAFVALTSDIKNSRPMNQALTSLVSTLRQPPYSRQIPFELVAHSSLAHFQARLERQFGAEAGFARRLSTVIYARSFAADQAEPLRARVRRVGMVQNSVDWPDPVGTPVEELNASLRHAESPHVTPKSHILREAAVYCFVAEKVSPARFESLRGPPGL